MVEQRKPTKPVAFGSRGAELDARGEQDHTAAEQRKADIARRRRIRNRREQHRHPLRT